MSLQNHSPPSLNAEQAACARNWFPERYHRQWGRLGQAALPFLLLNQESRLAILVKKGPTASRAILVLASESSELISQSLSSLLRQAQQHCRALGRSRLTLRYAVQPASGHIQSESLKRCLPTGWSNPERMQTYRRRNLRGLDKPLAWLAREYLTGADGANIRIVPWQAVVGDPNAAAHAQAAAPSHPELRPDGDFDYAYSFAAVRCRSEGQTDELLGWLIVSRRRHALLDHRLFVVPEYRNFWNLGTRLVAKSVIRQAQMEPDIGVRLHVRQRNPKVAARYATFLSPWIEQAEENWVSGT